ncbi:MAG: ErfK/YbiS/YcfS/YnhG family protein [Fibrobacteres bacterium]|nr:ErfK/YbiS/YcfS/YnhG family protein [Fibrobacterota bacterium]
MRLHFRPDYLFQKTVHSAFVSWGVRRDNKAVADAFRDPQGLDGVFRWRSPAARKARLIRLSLLIAALAGGLAAYRHYGTPTVADEETRLRDELGAPLTPAMPTMPPASDKPVKTSAPEPAIPTAASLVAAPASEPAPVVFPQKGFCLMACKRDRTLYVYKRDGAHWERTAAYPMAIGRNSGDKGDAGDMRTPEGRFWINGLVAGEMKGPLYGPLVYTLNYPRPGDAAEGKTGQGIWIHGVPVGKLPTFTHGCLSLANEDVVALSAFADIGTPVVILPDSLSPDPVRQIDVAGMEREYPSIMSAHMRRTRQDTVAKEETLKRARAFVAKEAKAFPELAMQDLSPEAKKAIMARLDKWKSDWASRSIDAYASNYDPLFKDRMGRDRETFLDRKRKIFESKSKIEMEIRDARIESEGYSRARITFRQDYLADGPLGSQRSSDMKSLRLEEGPGGWLIITE